MRVGILGSGLMGGKLGTIFARAGHEVIFIYPQRAEADPLSIYRFLPDSCDYNRLYKTGNRLS